MSQTEIAYPCRVGNCDRVLDSENGRRSHEGKAHPGTPTEPWHDKETLQRLYVEEKLSAQEIADKLGCAKKTVQDSMDKHGIEQRERARSMVLAGLQKDVYFFTSERGYEYVCTKHDGDRFRVAIHRLLAVSEFGPGEIDGKAIHHKNGVRWDNRPENIEPVEPGEHTRLHEFDPENRPWQNEDNLRHQFENGLTYDEMADNLGCSKATIIRWLRKYSLI